MGRTCLCLWRGRAFCVKSPPPCPSPHCCPAFIQQQKHRRSNLCVQQQYVGGCFHLASSGAAPVKAASRPNRLLARRPAFSSREFDGLDFWEGRAKTRRQVNASSSFSLLPLPWPIGGFNAHFGSSGNSSPPTHQNCQIPKPPAVAVAAHFLSC